MESLRILSRNGYQSPRTEKASSTQLLFRLASSALLMVWALDLARFPDDACVIGRVNSSVSDSCGRVQGCLFTPVLRSLNDILALCVHGVLRSIEGDDFFTNNKGQCRHSLKETIV